MPKSSRAMRRPSSPQLREPLDRELGAAHELALARPRARGTRAGARSRRARGAPASRARRASSWRADTLTDTTSPPWPASCHFLPCRQAARSVHCPSGTASPLTSASETKSAAFSMPVVAAPAQQRLHAHDRARLALDDRLPVQLAAPPGRAPGAARSRFACRSAASARERGACTSHASPPRSFARLHRDRRALQQRLRVRAVVREERDAEARGHRAGRGRRC